MKTGIAAAIGGLCICAWGVLATAAAETVSGQVIDLACYAENKANTGLDHGKGRSACAMSCVKWEGNPVGIVTAEGKVYQFTGPVVADNNSKIAVHLGHSVTVTGEVSEKDGMLMLTATDVQMQKK